MPQVDISPGKKYYKFTFRENIVEVITINNDNNNDGNNNTDINNKIIIWLGDNLNGIPKDGGSFSLLFPGRNNWTI